MAEVERYEDTDAYDFINDGRRSKERKRGDGPKHDPGPSINELGTQRREEGETKLDVF